MIELLAAMVAVPIQLAQAPADTGGDLVALGDSLHQAFEPERALAAYESQLEQSPEDFEALWKAARESVVMGVLAYGTQIENRWYERGEHHARQAVELRPDDTTALYWLVASMGKRAVQTDAMNAVRLGTAVSELAHRILEIDSLHAGAHHALGVLNFEIMKLGRVERFIATRILGRGALRDASWENAERHMNRAVELDPESPVYHLDLGKMYWFRERLSLARREFETVTQLAVRSPEDPDFKAEADLYLRRMR